MINLISIMSIIDINYFTTRKSDAVLFRNKLSEVYQDTTFHFISSGDRYYVCAEICRPKETIKDHKYQIEYLAYFLECKNFDIDDSFDDPSMASIKLRNVV